MKEIEIIPLAKKKMVRRRIPQAWVEAALTAPDQIVEGHGGRSVAQQRRKIRRREMLIRVVFEETEDKNVVLRRISPRTSNGTGGIKPHEDRIRCRA